MSAITEPTAKFVEHRVARGDHTLYVREYPGDGPAFVLLHGFPDNLHIYDRIAPLLADAGARVVAFDFLGYGASDKPDGYAYRARDWETDLAAVLKALKISRPILVAHDASGPTVLNYALDNPGQVGALALMNVYYGAAPSLRFPQFIAVYAEPSVRALGVAMLQDPNVFPWLMTWQGAQFAKDVPDEVLVLREYLTPHVGKQFMAKPSIAPAFLSVTGDLKDSVAANTARAPELARLTMPVGLIWGDADPYLNIGVAEHLQGLLPTAELTRLPLSHWPQITGPEAVTESLLQLAGRMP